MEDLSVSQWSVSVVVGSVEHLPVGRWSVVGGFVIRRTLQAATAAGQCLKGWE